jgi:hypothetical protein
VGDMKICGGDNGLGWGIGMDCGKGGGIG